MSAQRSFIRNNIKFDITTEQSKDSGLAILLIFLLLGFITENIFYFKLTIPVILIVMVVPGWLKPFGILWFTFSHLIGSVMSRLILLIIFIIVVVPVAYVRKLFGIDNLKLTEFKKNRDSVMYIRDHIFIGNDIEKPY